MSINNIKTSDLTGLRFGRLTVVKFSHKNEKRHYCWLCKCDCGNNIIVRGGSLNTGNTKSCGCLMREVNRNVCIKRNTTHGGTHTKLYDVWQSMRQRVNDHKDKHYADYGGRGITICDEWRKYEAFSKWAKENGYSNGLSIDRIDNDGNYEPQNCRWTTNKEQANNKRNNRLIEYNGEVKTLQEWADLHNIIRTTLCTRLKYGWSIDRAFNEPVKSVKKDMM